MHVFYTHTHTHTYIYIKEAGFDVLTIL